MAKELIILDHLAYRRRRKRKKPDWDIDFDELFEDDDGIFFEYKYEPSGMNHAYESSGMNQVYESSGSVYYRTYIEEAVEVEVASTVDDPCLTLLFKFGNPEWSCAVDIIVILFVITCFVALGIAIWNSRRPKSLTFDEPVRRPLLFDE